MAQAAAIHPNYTLRRLWVGAVGLLALFVASITAVFVYGQLFPSHVVTNRPADCGYVVQPYDNASSIAYSNGGGRALVDYIYRQGRPIGNGSRVLDPGQHVNVCP